MKRLFKAIFPDTKAREADETASCVEKASRLQQSANERLVETIRATLDAQQHGHIRKRRKTNAGFKVSGI